MSDETRVTMRGEITDLALRLHKCGIAPEAIAQEMLATGGGLLEQALGAKAAVAHFERLAEYFRREVDDIEEPKH